MVTGERPFNEAKVTDSKYLRFAIHRDDSYWNKQKYSDLSNELKELLTLMFQRNPITRPTFVEI
jgi:hypothetical protein